MHDARSDTILHSPPPLLFTSHKSQRISGHFLPPGIIDAQQLPRVCSSGRAPKVIFQKKNGCFVQFLVESVELRCCSRCICALLVAYASVNSTVLGKHVFDAVWIFRIFFTHISVSFWNTAKRGVARGHRQTSGGDVESNKHRVRGGAVRCDWL